MNPTLVVLELLVPPRFFELCALGACFELDAT